MLHQPTGRLFDVKLREAGLGALRAAGLTTLQVNVGKLCNQACRHCHVDAGPHQTGAAVNMARPMVELVVDTLRRHRFDLLDITGGAPELNPHFRWLVQQARDLGVRVMDRCNLSVLFQPGQADLAGFLAAHRVEVTASLPFYARDRTDRQRGAGVFDQSIQGLQLLNRHGYGQGDGLQLNLVYNPVGAYLPGDQAQLEAEYRRELGSRHGILFDRLFCLANLPIARFREWLERSGNAQAYRDLLLAAFNPAAVDGVMCRTLISVAPDGTLHDCDFNQMLGLPTCGQAPRHLRDFDAAALARRSITTGDHCLGCTAGAGSSCSGATTT